MKGIATGNETCKEAGIFDQAYLSLFEDDYRAITIFNEGSPEIEESVMDETEMEEGEPADAQEELADEVG